MSQQFLYLLNQDQLPGASSSQGHVTSPCTSQEHVIRVCTTLCKLVASARCTVYDTFPVFSPARDTCSVPVPAWDTCPVPVSACGTCSGPAYGPLSCTYYNL